MKQFKSLIHHFSKRVFETVGTTPTPKQEQFISDVLENAFEGHFCMKGEHYEEHLHSLYGLVIEKILDPSQKVTLPICEFKGLFYLHRNWYLERQIAQALQALAARPSYHLALDLSEMRLLNEQQKEALSLFATSSWMLLSGGPGRGKTFTAATLVASLPHNLRILVAAPTGKATWHLYDQMKKRAPSHLVEASTLHSLLYSLQAHQKIRHDVIIVDEASMIDAVIFYRFLDKIGPHAKFLLMGDIDQLPPVETGMVFSELFSFAQRMGTIPYVQLQHCYRSDRQDILTLAEQINQQSLSLENIDSEAVTFHPISQYKKEHLLDLAKKYYRFEGDNLEEAKKRFSQFRILTALQVGPFGVQSLNRYIHDALQKEGGSGGLFPIMITKTHYQLNIFNGETGFVMNHRVYLQKETGWICLPLPVIPSYELAYAMTIHKSQGSEYDHVILILPEGSDTFGKELLYTGVTRTRKKLEILSTQQIVTDCLRKKSERTSCLAIQLEI